MRCSEWRLSLPDSQCEAVGQMVASFDSGHIAVGEEGKGTKLLSTGSLC
jgi:hypothetical protein